MKIINRPIYMQKLIDYRDTDIVKIVTGIRRSGKSTLLELFKGYLVEQGIPQRNIIHMNMESLQYKHLLDYESFYDYISGIIIKNEKNYLFLMSYRQ